MYEYYHNYFMDKYNQTVKPTAYDVLGIILPDEKKTKAKVKPSWIC